MADYVIQRGDTLGAIAARLGTTVQALAQANGISNPNLIRAGATLTIPGQGPAPTTGAMPMPRPERTQVAAASPPLPVSNPMRAPPPLPVPNPQGQSAPVPLPVPRPPAPPPAPDTSMEDTYNQPGLSPQQVQQYQGQGQWVTPSAPRPPGNGVGIQTAAVERGNPLPAPPAEPIQVTTLPQRQLEQLLTLGAARQIPPDLYQTVQMEMQRRTEMMRIEAERAQQMAAIQAEADRSRNMQFDAPAYRAENGTSPRAIPPGQQPSIGEGEYLPAEMIRLGQLGANMNSAPRANTMLPTLGLLSGPRRQPQTLGNLAYTGV